jgi:hypothetical protein
MEGVVGCYQVVSVDWTSPKPLSYQEHDLPALFFLSGNRLPYDGLLQVRFNASHLGSGYWRLTDDGAIEATWTARHDTLAYVRVSIRRDGGSEMWQGSAHTDGLPGLRARVVVRKIPDVACASMGRS